MHEIGSRGKEGTMPVMRPLFLAFLFSLTIPHRAVAAEVKVLTAGVMKEVILALIPDFERAHGYKVTLDNDTAGALSRRIEGGEAVDLAVITVSVIDGLIGKGKLAPGRTDLATVGIGVVVKEGGPFPDISSVDAFKRLLLAAKSIAQVDPASGGTSGVYLMNLYERLGIADQIKPKLVLVQGGSSAPLVTMGEAEIAIQQISEIIAVPGVAFAGPLPKEIQNITVYSAALGAQAKEPEAARALMTLLRGTQAVSLLRSKGMAPATP
jgi:molybdate transport system substrate-binding protein